MKQDEALIYAYGFKAGLERAWRIYRIVDRNQKDYPMPMELTARMAKAKGEVEDFIYERCGNESSRDR